MLPLTVTASERVSASPFDRTIEPEEANSGLSVALANLRRDITSYSASSPATVTKLQRQLVAVANQIVAEPRPDRRAPWVQDALALAREIRDGGLHDVTATAEQSLSAPKLFARGWTGVLAGMVVVPAWQLSDTLPLDLVPDWLWSDYAAWLFSVPGADVVRRDSAEVQLKRLLELERWVTRNSGSAAVRSAMAAYLETTAGAHLAAEPAIYRRIAEIRGRILQHFHARNRSAFEPALTSRQGRRLRVGIVAADFGSSPTTYSLLPRFEQIDSKAFSIFLFPLNASATPEAEACTRRATAVHVLPAGTAERVGWLRSAQLDVLIFAGSVGPQFDGVTELALHRIAPLQAVTDLAGATSGLPEIDLFLSSDSRVCVQGKDFTERVGLMRGSAFCISLAGAATAKGEGTRAAAGLPESNVLLCTVVGAAGAAADLVAAWTEILSRDPAAHLAIAFAQDASESRLRRFCATIDRALEARGVEQTRVTVFPTSASRPHEVRALMALADVYLDSGSPSLARWTTVEALQLGMPVVTLTRDVSDVSGALKSVGLESLVANSAEQYATIATALVAEPARRAAIRTQLEAALEVVPDFLDSLAASDSFAALLEAAFDELESLGRKEFRAQHEPVRCFGFDDIAGPLEAGFAALARGESETAAMEASLALRSNPGDVRARHLQGAVLHAQGNLPGAVKYLLAAVQQSDAASAVWFTLALVLRDQGRTDDAIQALETCIRLDPHNVDALLVLLELAERVGATEIARDVLDWLRQVAPEDPRIVALT